MYKLLVLAVVLAWAAYNCVPLAHLAVRLSERFCKFAHGWKEGFFNTFCTIVTFGRYKPYPINFMDYMRLSYTAGEIAVYFCIGLVILHLTGIV